VETFGDVAAVTPGRLADIDVLINNAGYGDIRPFEQTSPEDFKKLVDTCFLRGGQSCTRGPAGHAQAAQRPYHPDLVGRGRFATAGGTAYHAAKWAVGGFTEALAQETAPFGDKVCAVEPGSMRTN
jgi:NAD(P)-dependent dehydrogenase (short-subunit alcohol dehydrogenase family)